jgi:hypothetical protein
MTEEITELDVLIQKTQASILMSTLMERAPWKANHSKQVGAIVFGVLVENNLDERQSAMIALGAWLHDVSAADTPELVELTNATHTFSDNERMFYRAQHTVRGGIKAVKNLRGVDKQSRLSIEHAAYVIKHHHDDSGFLAEQMKKPVTTAGYAESTLLAQVADTMHAVTMPRPYRITDRSRKIVTGRYSIAEAEEMAAERFTVARALFDVPTPRVISAIGEQLSCLQDIYSVRRPEAEEHE